MQKDAIRRMLPVANSARQCGTFQPLKRKKEIIETVSSSDPYCV